MVSYFLMIWNLFKGKGSKTNFKKMKKKVSYFSRHKKVKLKINLKLK